MPEPGGQRVQIGVCTLQISDFQYRREEEKSIQGYVPFCIAAFFKGGLCNNA
jgi:hypothetical protein